MGYTALIIYNNHVRSRFRPRSKELDDELPELEVASMSSAVKSITTVGALCHSFGWENNMNTLRDDIIITKHTLLN